MNTHFIKIWICFSLLLFGRQAIAQDVWKEYKFDNVGCAASFPIQPATAQENSIWTAQAKSENTIYQIVVYLNQSYSDVEATLTESVEGFINPAIDEIVKREDIRINGLPAKQIQVRSQDGTFLVFRTWVGKGKLYQVAVAGTNPTQTLAKAQKFLDSLKLP